MNNNIPLQVTINTIGNKWRLQILYELRDSRLRFSSIKQKIPHITNKTLIHELRELMACGLVERIMYPQIPPRVEYFLSSLGKSTIPLMESMVSWGNYYSSCQPKIQNYTPLSVDVASRFS